MKKAIALAALALPLILGACSGGSGSSALPATSSSGSTSLASSVSGGPALSPGTTIASGSYSGTATLFGAGPSYADFKTIGVVLPQAPTSLASHPLQVTATVTYSAALTYDTSFAIAPYQCSGGVPASVNSADPGTAFGPSLSGDPTDVSLRIPAGATSATLTARYFLPSGAAGQYCLYNEFGTYNDGKATAYSVSYTITQP